MALFTKKIGPVFLKASNQAEDYITKLKALLVKCPPELQDEIEKQIAITEYGLKGEQNIAFELKNSGTDMYILQDIYLEHEGLSAQIDYIIITRKRVYVIECKNLIGDIEINSAGDFIRTYQIKGRKVKEGFYSPITQNSRHLQIIKEVRKTIRGNFITKQIFENHFDENYKSIVVLANSKTVLYAKYAKREIKEQIVRADQLIHKIKEMDQLVKESMSEKEMRELADFFLEKNQPCRLDYAEKYEKLLAQVEEVKEKTSDAQNLTSKNAECMYKLRTELKAFRLKRSRQENIKPYYIFNDAQMEDLIQKNPKSKAELCKVSGFGPVKVEKYGDEILEILRKQKF